MPSPFPGMNPFLEQSDTWLDFHNSFITYARDALASQLGANYLAKIEVRLILHELPIEERRFIGVADVGISKSRQPTPAGVGMATLAAPMHLEMPAVDVERHASLEIRDKRNRRVITALELLSPSNKSPGENHDDYLAKRRQVLAGLTNFVEIDLLRGGRRPNRPKLPQCDYYALVSRFEKRSIVDFWPIGLRDPLPVIPVPLLEPDADLKLDLRAVLDRVYDSAYYGRYIYEEKPEPPLAPKDAKWAKQFIRAN